MARFCVGLTGGIGTGKSLASALFASHGIDIIDTDVIARQLLDKQGALFGEVCSHFGDRILSPDGTIDRSALRHIIFNTLAEKQWLEALMHPAIRAEAKRQLDQSKTPYAVMVIPLLAEADLSHYPYLNRICVVHALETLQIKRTMERDHISRDTAIKIIRHQASHEARMAIATDEIENNGDEWSMTEAVNALHRQYLTMANF